MRGIVLTLLGLLTSWVAVAAPLKYVERMIMNTNITIQLDDPTSDGARRLIAELDKYQGQLYPAESNHLVPVEAHSQRTF
jgi:hypothetical protein